MSDTADNIVAEVQAYSNEAPACVGATEPDIAVMPPRTIRRNMTCCVMMDAIWNMGWSDVMMALSPLLVYLNASNALIGVVTGAMFLCIPGVLLSPFITRRFPYKKWYFLTANVPYLFALAAAGIATIISPRAGWSNSTLLTIVAASMIIHWFFGGFVALPHNEYLVACIPSSHRGRLTGLSYSVGSILGIVSTMIGGVILLKLPKPMSFGILFVMAWFIMQSGYVAALFAKEQRTPVEKSPKPWSIEMIKAFWNDKNYVKFTITQLLLTLFLGTAMWQFINIYGLKDLKMAPATSAVMLLVSQVVRIAASTPLGILTDRIGPKRLYPMCMLAAAVVYWPAVLMRNELGVYISIGLSVIFLAGVSTSGSVLSYSLPKPEYRAGHYTILTLFGVVVMSLGPILVGLLADTFSYRGIFMFISGVAVVLFFVLSYLCRTFPATSKEMA